MPTPAPWLVDSLEVVHAYLMSNAALVSALTDSSGVTHIYGPPGTPDGWVLQRAITFDEQSPRPSLDLPVTHENLQFLFYGTSPWDARQTYLLAYPVLHRISARWVTVTGGQALLMKSHIGTGPINTYNSDENRFFLMAVVDIDIGELVHP